MASFCRSSMSSPPPRLVYPRSAHTSPIGLTSSGSPPSSNSISMNVNSSSSHSNSLKGSRAASLEWDADTETVQEDHSALHTIMDDAQQNQAYPALIAHHRTSHHSDTSQLNHPSRDIIDEVREELEAGHVTKKSSPGSSVFVLSATTLGAGILALPYAFTELGWLFGTLLLLSVGFISSYAIRLLLTTARTVGATTYEDLGHAIYPTFGKRMVVSTTLILIFGGLTAFFVIIADTFTPAVQNIVGNSSSFFVKREVLLVMVALVFVFPLCMLRSIHALERWSFLAVGIILSFSVLIVIDSIKKIHEGKAGLDADGNNPNFSKNIRPYFFDVDMFEALPIICLAFTCQTMIFPIWNNLQSELSTDGIPTLGLASVNSMQKVANRALILCGSLYLPVGLFGFFSFGLSTKGDVLNNFPDNEVFYDIVRVFFTIAIGIHYPVVHFGFRSAILTTWYAEFTEVQNRKRFWIITVSACFFSLVLAIILPNLSTVFGLTGAVCAFPYCFMFPTLFYLRLHQPGAQVLMRPHSVSDLVLSSHPHSDANNSVIVVADIPRVSGGRAYHPVPSGVVSTSSPLLDTRPQLSTRSKLAAYSLLIVASILWIISIVVSFRDMVNDFRKNGI